MNLPRTKNWIIGLTVSLLASSAFATPFTPKSDDQVLERLRLNVNDAAARELRDLRGQLQTNPQNLKLAVTLAQKYIERARSEADPRYNGRAQAVLAPWWNLELPPEPALVLRATLKQNVHDFNGALLDLDKAAKLEPRDPQIWVTRSVVQTVLGNLIEAKRSCLPLFQTSTELVAVTCVANAASLNGQAFKAFRPSSKCCVITLKPASRKNLGRLERWSRPPHDCNAPTPRHVLKPHCSKILAIRT